MPKNDPAASYLILQKRVQHLESEVTIRDTVYAFSYSVPATRYAAEVCEVDVFTTIADLDNHAPTSEPALRALARCIFVGIALLNADPPKPEDIYEYLVEQPVSVIGNVRTTVLQALAGPKTETRKKKKATRRQIEA